jgi:DNA ligase (NAD+)
MEMDAAKKRIEELSEEINLHNYNYYVLDSSVISDFEFDELLKQLAELENNYPEFLYLSSPSQKVGGQVTKDFKSVKHKFSMLSLSNSYSLDEIYDFDERVRKGLELGNDSLFTKEIEYVCELKFDGLSISLIYVDGIFSQAITRGDGLQGYCRGGQQFQLSAGNHRWAVHPDGV